MKFVYPAGLWSLCGVLILIGVYLLRHKYDETIISSTYLWKLAERFSRKNASAQKLKKALLFALQLLSVAMACLMIAQPLIRLPGADTHYVAVLDGSASMQIADGAGTTRFSRAVETAIRDLSKLPWGSSVTVVVAGDSAETVVQRQTVDEAENALKQAQCGWGSGTLKDALAIGQEILSKDQSAQVCLYTDRDYAQADNLEIRNVKTDDEWNVSVSALNEKGSIYGTEFQADVTSYGKTASVGFDLYVDGELLEPSGVDVLVNGEKQEDGHAVCPKDETVTVSLMARQLYSYSNVRVAVRAEDGMAADNEYQLYRKQEKMTRVLLAGKKTFFVSNALSVFSDIELTSVQAPEDTALHGYDLYVFDGCIPKEMPEDGAVWLLNPPAVPKGVDIAFGEELRGANIAAARELADERMNILKENLLLRDASVVRFREVTSCGQFAPVLLCGRMPVLLAGKTQTGCAMLVMPFDLQKSSLPLLSDFVILVHNMLQYCVPPMLDAQAYDCGVTLRPQMLPLCEKLFVQLPDMSIRTMPMDGTPIELTLAAPGGYTLMQELPEGKEKILDFFAHVPPEEGRVSAPEDGQTLLLRADAEIQEEQHEPEKQYFNPLRFLAGILLVLMILEWGMYHREKY